MCQAARPHVARAKEDEAGEEAEHRRIAKLENGTQQSNHDGHARVRELELIQVVQVCEAKVQRRDEDERRVRLLACRLRR